MATSLITKKRIAKSFKKLLTEQAFEENSSENIIPALSILKWSIIFSFSITVKRLRMLSNICWIYLSKITSNRRNF